MVCTVLIARFSFLSQWLKLTFSVVVVFDIDQIISIDESIETVEVCASIAEGFIERESDIVFLSTAVEFQSEATLGK